MTTLRVFLPALGAGFLFTFPGAGDELVFAPEPGSAVTKTFEVAGEYELDEISLMVNGQDIGAMLGEIRMSLEARSHIEVTDTYAKVEGGRALVLLRTYDELGSSVSMDVSPSEGDLPEFESSSPLEGLTVAFKWNGDKEAYEPSFPDGDGDQNLLEDLEEGMDMRLFLPASEVAEGDSWSVDLGELQCLVMPGGNLKFEPEGVDVDDDAKEMFEELFGNLGEELGELFDGECLCTYKGSMEVDGARVAEIAIEIEVATTLDLANALDRLIRTMMEREGVGESVDLSIDTADLNLDFEGSGTLLWGLGAGRLHSFQLDGDVLIDMDFAVSVEVEGESQGLDASLEMSGSLSEEVTTRE